MAQRVLTEVQSLPKTQHSAVLMVYVEGMSYREAAEVLEVPIGTVMSRLAAARQTLGRLKRDQADKGQGNRMAER